MPLMDVGNQLVWHAIKFYLPPNTRLTSVRRSPEAQIAIIKKYAAREKYAFTKPPTLAERSSWLGALEFLRKKGYKIAEPGQSYHEKGLAYDFTGPDLEKIKAGIQKAVAAGRIKLVDKRNNLIIEKRNNCVHAEIQEAILDYEPFDYA